MQQSCKPVEEYNGFISFVSREKHQDQCYFVTPGEVIPGLPGYILDSIDSEKITLKLSHLYDNSNLVESLLDMDKISSSTKYLDLAEKILEAIAKYYILDDGTVRSNWLYFQRHAPVYKGMAQAILMHSLNRFLQVRNNQKLEIALLMLSKTFVHTDEGCNNHFTNSIMGLKIAQQKIGTNLYIPGRAKSELITLIASIEENKGKISYVMKRSRKYPEFKDSYQSYDFFILGRTLYFYFSTNESKSKVKSVFNKMIETTEKISFNNTLKFTSDYVRYASIIVQGLLYYNLAYSFDVSDYVSKYFKLVSRLDTEQKLPNNLDDTNTAINVLNLISGLALYVDSNSNN